jgi:hypothetical protein
MPKLRVFTDPTELVKEVLESVKLKEGLTVNIPGAENVLDIKVILTDFTGTLSNYGVPVPGIIAVMNSITEKQAPIAILTVDTFKKAAKAMESMGAGGGGFMLIMKSGEDIGVQKTEIVQKLASVVGIRGIVFLGNGRADVEPSKAIAEGGGLTIGIVQREGAAMDLLSSGVVKMVFTNPVDAYEALHYHKKGEMTGPLTATLRVT